MPPRMFELINKKAYRILFALALIGTLIATLSVATELVRAGLINDKLAHGLIFFVLTFLCFHAMPGRYGLRALVALAFFGLAIEIIQHFLPYRNFSWLDWASDIAGIVLYDLIHRLKILILSTKSEQEP